MLSLADRPGAVHTIFMRGSPWSLASVLALFACSDASVTEEAGSNPNFFAENDVITAETWADVDRLICRPEVLDVCGPKKCAASKPVTYVVWYPKTGQYERCDNNGCDTYQSQLSLSGLFANVTIPGSGSLLRLTSSGQFTEVATLMDTTFVYRGRCTRD